MTSPTDLLLGWRDCGARIAVTNGCFDVLHAGHVRALNAAAEHGVLVVLLNSDESVRRLKGETRPIQRYGDRAEMLRALRAVALVMPFDDVHCAAELSAVRPDVYVKCEEYRDRQHPAERAALEACGARVVWLPRDPRYSTTRLIRRIAAAARADSARLPANHNEVPRTDPNWGLA